MLGSGNKYQMAANVRVLLWQYQLFQTQIPTQAIVVVLRKTNNQQKNCIQQER